jgi:hypothetical protein
MAGHLEQPTELRSVGDLFTDIHRQAHAVASAVPVFDSRKTLEIGEVYAYEESWIHPGYEMPVTSTAVRVLTKDAAPYLLEVWSLHPEDETDVVLPARVSTFNQFGKPGVYIDRYLPNGLITVERGASFDANGVEVLPQSKGGHKSATEIDRLKKSDRERLDAVRTGSLGTIAAMRCLVSVDIAAKRLPQTNQEAQLLAAHASIADVFTLLRV